MELNIGDKAPEFSLKADDEQTISLRDLRGKKVILYFYPKDSTPGCTQEACDFSGSFAELSRQNAVVLGVSKDSPQSHRRFKEKYSLPFPLLCDTDAKVCVAYGVMNPKSMYGKTFLAIQRSTFLIDEEGIIQGIWRQVKVPKHVETVFNHLLQLTE